jgi:hypothetical protein
MTTDEVSSPRPGWISQRLAPKTATGGHSRGICSRAPCGRSALAQPARPQRLILAVIATLISLERPHFQVPPLMTCWRRSCICRLGDQVGGWPTWTPTGLPDSSPAMDCRHHGDVGARLLCAVRVRSAAYAITVLGVPARTIGTASAVNCLVIVVLQMAVVKWTAKRSAPSLLVAVGSIWVLSWLLLAAASLVPVLAGTMFIVVFGVFAVGETMYAPVLNPLTASLAPSGMVGTTLGIFAALQTGVSAAGPMLAGVALTAGHRSLFVGVHVGISLVAVFAALRLRSLLAGAREHERQPAGRHTGDGRRARRRGRNRHSWGVSGFVAGMPVRQHALTKQTG